MTADQIKAQFPGYSSWNDPNAIVADFNATGGAGKGGSSSSSGGQIGVSIPSFSFNWDEATKNALTELTPYYEKLLSMYKGDIALAKQHMDQDYERGLRVQSEKTDTGIADVNATKAERNRKFKIALGDLDQTMNARGLTTSGIKTNEISKSTADEKYQQGLLDNQARDLTKGLEYYKEDLGATRDAQLEKWGMKTVSDANNPTGQYAPSNDGLNTTGYSVGNYTPEPVQKQTELERQKQLDAQTKAENAYNRAVTLWQTQVQQLTS